MKKYTLLFMLILLTACNSKSDKKAQQEQADTYINQAGEVKGDEFVISNLDIIRAQWEQSVQISLSGTATLKDFTIKKVMTEGERTEEGYILQATTNDGMAKVAALIELKEGKFYFVENPSAPRSYRITICTSNCETGCDPVVSIVNGEKALFCSSCPSCERIDSTI